MSKKEVNKGDEEELQQLKKVLKESLHDEIKRSLEKTSTSDQPKELKDQMEAIKSLLSDLNQDKEAVKQIAKAVTVHNKRQRLQEEEKAKQEEEALVELRRKRKEEEEEACKSKGKEKLADLPSPSPKPLSFQELSPEPMDFEEEIRLK